MATKTNTAFNIGAFSWSWIFIAAVLLGLASFKSGERIAAAFSYLILVSVILIDGETAIKNIQNNTLFGSGTSNDTNITSNTPLAPAPSKQQIINQSRGN